MGQPVFISGKKKSNLSQVFFELVGSSQKILTRFAISFILSRPLSL